MFRRAFFSYIGISLDGEYWLPGMRFAPVTPEDDNRYTENAEQVVSIDMVVEAIDEVDANALAEGIGRRQAARLSLLLDVGLFRNPSCLRWGYMAEEAPPKKAVRVHLGFWGHGPTLTDMPEKGTVCPLGKYSGSLGARSRVRNGLLSLPPQARRILRAIDTALPVVSEAFDGAARLYQAGAMMGAQFPSVGLAYRVAAVEALSNSNRSYEGFSGFMRRHVTSEAVTDQVLDYLYGNVRSAHFHAGVFPLGEFESIRWFNPLMDEVVLQRSLFQHTCFKVTREAIINWLHDLLPSEQAEE